MPKKKYDCLNCPGYCCSYPRINVSKKDILRLAKYFNVSVEKAKSRFTRNYKYKNSKTTIIETVLRHRKDDIYKSTCQFLDQKSRNCTVYEARPKICREYPVTKKCGYYEFLTFEREQQGDKTFIPSC
jgi:Fe-S-cluster containining protein